MGFSPYYLMFGCKPCLPIDLIFGTNITDLKGNHIIYIETLRKEWPGCTKLQMMLLRRNRKGRNNVMTVESNVQS